jgi:hypothetical protein
MHGFKPLRNGIAFAGPDACIWDIQLDMLDRHGLSKNRFNHWTNAVNPRRYRCHRSNNTHASSFRSPYVAPQVPVREIADFDGFVEANLLLLAYEQELSALEDRSTASAACDGGDLGVQIGADHRLDEVMLGATMKLELGCGTLPTAGYVHHDRRRHSPHVDVVHDLNKLPWPWEDESCEEILGLDVFEHLHLMPEEWLRECYRILVLGGALQLRVPIFGSPWHVIDPTHVRGFHPLNFDYFVRERELWQKYGCYYFDFAFQEAEVKVEQYNIIATLKK